MKLFRTNSAHIDFVELVKELDKSLVITDGDEHAFYDQYNKLDNIKYVIVAYEDEQAIACGAIKQFDDKRMEIKRMYTKPQNRSKGIASKILAELEQWAKELSFEKCILETGKRQLSAIKLYKKNGYSIIENYGQYNGMENSICFEKKI